MPSPIFLSREYAEKRVAEVLASPDRQLKNSDKQPIVLIKTKKEAIAVAEAILFGIDGREHVLKEQPYSVHKVGDYWYVAGSVPKFFDGGAFEIILDSRDAQVLRIAHDR